MHGLNFNVVSELSLEGGSIFAEVPPTEAYPARAEELERRAPAVVLETRADVFFFFFFFLTCAGNENHASNVNIRHSTNVAVFPGDGKNTTVIRWKHLVACV